MANGLSDEQFDALGDLIKQSVSDALDERQVSTKEDIKHLPTKDEFYTETSKLYKKLEDMEEEKDVLSHQVSRNSDRLDKVEKHLNL
jgi:septal ring factor EnvC (AmiA/AmiB activator)